MHSALGKEETVEAVVEMRLTMRCDCDCTSRFTVLSIAPSVSKAASREAQGTTCTHTFLVVYLILNQLIFIVFIFGITALSCNTINL